MPFEECTYVANIAGRQDCLVVDPGLEPELILQHLDEQKLTPAAILNTHGHADHIGGNQALKERWPQCPLIIGHGDAPMLTNPALNLSAGFGVSLVSPPADETVSEGQTYSAAGFDLEVHEIPGHSPGHVIFICKAIAPYHVFGGDGPELQAVLYILHAGAARGRGRGRRPGEQALAPQRLANDRPCRVRQSRISSGSRPGSTTSASVRPSSQAT